MAAGYGAVPQRTTFAVMKRIAVFASGQGTNASNLIAHFRDHEAVRVMWVVSNRKDAPVLERARDLGVEASYIEVSAWEDGSMLEALRAHKIDLIVLAGFLKLIPVSIITAYKGRIINIHPSLLPKFGGKGMYGKNVHAAVAAAHETHTGITIHHVNEHFDEGEIIAQYSVALDPNDDASAIEKKVRSLEKEHFAPTVEKWASGNLV